MIGIHIDCNSLVRFRICWLLVRLEMGLIADSYMYIYN